VLRKLYLITIVAFTIMLPLDAMSDELIEKTKYFDIAEIASDNISLISNSLSVCIAAYDFSALLVEDEFPEISTRIRDHERGAKIALYMAWMIYGLEKTDIKKITAGEFKTLHEKSEFKSEELPKRHKNHFKSLFSGIISENEMSQERTEILRTANACSHPASEKIKVIYINAWRELNH